MLLHYSHSAWKILGEKRPEVAHRRGWGGQERAAITWTKKLVQPLASSGPSKFTLLIPLLKDQFSIPKHISLQTGKICRYTVKYNIALLLIIFLICEGWAVCDFSPLRGDPRSTKSAKGSHYWIEAFEALGCSPTAFTHEMIDSTPFQFKGHFSCTREKKKNLHFIQSHTWGYLNLQHTFFSVQ